MRARHLDDPAGERDVVVEGCREIPVGLATRVDHDAGEPAVDGPGAVFVRAAVVEVENGGYGGVIVDDPAQTLPPALLIGVGAHSGDRLDDHRRALHLGGVENGDRLIEARHVEGADGIPSLFCAGEGDPERDQTHSAPHNEWVMPSLSYSSTIGESVSAPA